MSGFFFLMGLVVGCGPKEKSPPPAPEVKAKAGGVAAPLSPQEEAKRPTNERLTEAYYPLVPGRVRKYDAKDFAKPENAGLHHVKELADGTFVTQKVGGLQLKEQRRVENGYVSLGNRTAGGSFPIVKLGAKVADTWEIPSPHKDSTRITFLYDKSFSHKGKSCAVVIQTEYRAVGNSFVAAGDPWYKVTYWLVKDIGPVHREQHRMNKGQWELRGSISYEEW